jgi:predicted phosphodiesterase
MRIAVIADIHGNVDALKAVVGDVSARRADRIVNLGDCVSGPLWPSETMDLLQAMDLPTVRGNHDRWVAHTPREEMGPSDAFAHDHLTPGARQALGDLPARLDLGEGITAVHGTAADDNQYLIEDVVAGGLALASARVIAARVGRQAGRVLLCAHSHQPRIAQGPGGLLIVNPGSVGCPAYVDPTPPSPHISETGSPHARYALVTGDASLGVWGVDLIAVAYDWDRAAARAAANGRAQWACALATGYVR